MISKGLFTDPFDAKREDSHIVDKIRNMSGENVYMNSVHDEQQGTSTMLDALTGIFNRKGFYAYTREMIDQHPEVQFCLIYWNIRRFKVVNNMFGWHTGDEILVQLAESMKKELKNELATYGRVERDNFICCVPIEVISEGRWMKMGNLSYQVGDLDYHFSCCYGIYKITDPSLSISEMGDKARIAMETVKDNYMCSYAWFDEGMWNSLLEEQKLNSDFKHAISQKQFMVYYQPVCRTEDGKVIAAEALVRWKHPKRGLISPGIFISLFEKNGFISILDRYVWNAVCKMLRGRIDRGQEVVPISINVSKVEFCNAHICEDIRNIVKSYHLPTELIRIEITETAYSDNPSQVQEAVKKLHDYGFVVLMDDFGSGYSSLNILKDLPIDVLKIDMKFLDGFETSQKSAIILEAVIRMAKWMNLRVVAEGVEDRKEWDYLKSMECDLVQGFYFYRPMPEEDFLQLLDQKEENAIPVHQDEFAELENAMVEALRKDNYQDNSVFYSMLGGMGVYEMTDDRLEAIQVNRGYYEAIYNSAERFETAYGTLNREVKEPERSILMEKCRLAQKTKSVQQAQIHFQREDGIYVWLNIKVRYMSSQGKRSLFNFSIENIDEMKKMEEERYLSYYSAALMKVFDKVYRLNYETGIGEVLHTAGTDYMQVHQSYYFKDFFERYKDYIEWIDCEPSSDIIKNKELLDRKLEESKNGSYSVHYKAYLGDGKIQLISALFTKLEIQSGKEEYLCCIKREDVAE